MTTCLFNNDHIKITDLHVSSGFLGSVVKFENNGLYISEPTSIFEFIFIDSDLKRIAHNFETLSPSYSGYIFDFSICESNTNLIAVGSIGIMEDNSSVFIYNKFSKKIVWSYSGYNKDSKLLWQNGILLIKFENGSGRDLVFDTNSQKKSFRILEGIDNPSFKQTPNIIIHSQAEFNQCYPQLELFLRDCISFLELDLKYVETDNIIFGDGNYNYIVSIITNPSLDKFVIVLNDDRHILCEILKPKN